MAKAIQLLADVDIARKWDEWRKEDEDAGTKGGAQEKLRKAVALGLDVMDGRLVAVDPDRKRVYDAIETLLRAGLLADPLAPKNAAGALGTGKKPQLDGLRRQFAENRR
jgi:hypothetical protein